MLSETLAAQCEAATIDHEVEWCHKQSHHSSVEEPGLDPMHSRFRAQGLCVTVPDHETEHRFVALSLKQSQYSQHQKQRQPSRMHQHSRKPIREGDHHKPAAFEIVDVVECGVCGIGEFGGMNEHIIGVDAVDG